MASILGYAPMVAAGAAFAFSSLWTFDRIVSYFTKSEAENVVGFKGAVIPDDGSASPSVLATFHELGISPMFHERQTSIRLHIAGSAVLLSLFIMQATPWIRQRSYKLHRVLGTLAFPLVIATQVQIAYILFVQGMVPISRVLHWGNAAALTAITLGYGTALKALNDGDLAAHRGGMIVAIAGFLVNPVQRFFWGVFGKGNWGGPYGDWDAHRRGALDPSELVALALCGGTAAYFVLLTKPDAKDVAAFKRRAAGGGKAEASCAPRFSGILTAAYQALTAHEIHLSELTCYWCQASKDRAALRRCASCKSVWYCSVDCQKADWPKHKLNCGRHGDPAAAVAAAG
ncbi:hypothetical protein DFJ74DRAFT_774051 [Hyaloraphidium curvatum]|nr:hypothetical protein DFJ74DRAFT_774051 [Hyaloraphidium curvatum]